MKTRFRSQTQTINQSSNSLNQSNVTAFLFNLPLFKTHFLIVIKLQEVHQAKIEFASDHFISKSEVK
jgi:hypothetical protein